jgi:hypothetical protein
MIARIKGRLENFNPLAGYFGTIEATNQLLGFTRKHGAAHNLNPAPASYARTRTNAGFYKHKLVS